MVQSVRTCRRLLAEDFGSLGIGGLIDVVQFPEQQSGRGERLRRCRQRRDGVPLLDARGTTEHAQLARAEGTGRWQDRGRHASGASRKVSPSCFLFPRWLKRAARVVLIPL